MAVLYTRTWEYTFCTEGTVISGVSYTTWKLKMKVDITSETSTTVGGNITIYFVRATDVAGGGYYYNNGNSLSVSVGDTVVLSSANVCSLQIPGGAISETQIWTGTWTGAKDSTGKFSQTFSATFIQTQKPNPYTGTVSGTFVVEPATNVYVYTGGAWKRGVPYVYTNSTWKKASGKVAVRKNNTWAT